MRSVLLLLMGTGAMAGFAQEPARRLPRPHYDRADADPAWLAYAAQFHGHLGPWATAGTRLGMVGLRAVGAEGYFDVQVTCEGPFVRPPRSCFLDGLQVATGATLGKRNLTWKQSKQIVVRVTNTRTGAQAEVRPTAELQEMLASLTTRPLSEQAADADDDHHPDPAVEALARRIANMADQQLLVIRRIPQ